MMEMDDRIVIKPLQRRLSHNPRSDAAEQPPPALGKMGGVEILMDPCSISRILGAKIESTFLLPCYT